MAAHQYTHCGPILLSSLARDRAAQHIAPWVMDMKFPVEAASQAGSKETQNEICFFSGKELWVEAYRPAALDRRDKET